MEPVTYNSTLPPVAREEAGANGAAPRADLLSPESPPAAASDAGAGKTAFVPIVGTALGAPAFLYFARPVVLPIVLAVVAAMTLKPLIRWLSEFRLPPAFSAAVVLCLFVSAVGFGFLELGRPAMAWMNEAPAHMAELRQRVQKMFPRVAGFSQAAEAVNNLGASKAEQPMTTTVEFKTSRVPSTFINWTGTFLAGLGEAMVLLYLLLASGDLFLQKLVRVLPTFSDKKRAVEISHEIQQNITNYLFSVSLIFWTWLWGVPGALLSVPMLVSIKVVCDRLPTLSSVSELLSS